jgi:hypothetical protein
MAQQTAVEWLWNEIDNLIPYQDINKAQQFNGLLEQANQMFQEQIAEAYRKGVEEDVYNNPLKTGNEYYNETYGK